MIRSFQRDSTDCECPPNTSEELKPKKHRHTANMLGAKARAAEYHAAKAASARQACREAEEQKLPPKAAPISLSAFTKTAAVSRNKGAKAYKPLVLSDSTEDDRSMTSLELPIDNAEASSSPIASTPFNRPQSLPISSHHSFNSGAYGQDLSRSEYDNIPTAPRAMFPIDEHLMFGQHTPMHLQQTSLLPFPQISMSTYMTHPFTPMQYGGWYFPNHDLTSLEHLPYYPEAGLSPKLSYSEPRIVRPNPVPSRVSDSIVPARMQLDTPKKQEQVSAEFSVGGEQLYVFGPDDVSPTKIEVKESYRRQLLEEHPELCASPTAISVIAAASSSNSTCMHQYYQQGSRPGRSEKDQTTILHPVTMENFSNVMPPANPNSETKQDIFQCDQTLLNQSKEQLGLNLNRTPMPVALPLGIDLALSRKRKETMPSEETAIQSPRLRNNLELSELLSRWEQYKACNTPPLQPPPGLGPTPITNHDQIYFSHSCVNEHEPSTEHPLANVDLNSWCRFPPDNSEEERMREQMKIARASLTIDMATSLFHKAKAVGAEAPDTEELLHWHFEQKENKKRQVTRVAEELREKWLKSTPSQPYSASSCTVDEAVRVVKTVGGAMASLSQYEDESKDPMGFRACSFGSVPEYATEKSVNPGRDGTYSMFEIDDGENSVAPARIARDPRYRQHNISHSSRSDGDKIARLLGAGRRI